jgi:hypothetical protein
MEKHKRWLEMRFLVTSAINNDERRCYELLGTLESIWKRFPLSSIVLTESSRCRPDKAFLEAIPRRVHLVPFWDCDFIHEAHDSGLPRGFIQNSIEMQVMIRSLDWLTEANNYKVSGRYQLTDDFNPGSHDPEKLVFKRRIPTGFSLEECGTSHMYMTRCYGIPSTQIPTLELALKRSLAFHWSQWKDKKVFDIEHGLFKFLPETSIQEVDKMGVIGRIGHLEHIVED